MNHHFRQMRYAPLIRVISNLGEAWRNIESIDDKAHVLLHGMMVLGFDHEFIGGFIQGLCINAPELSNAMSAQYETHLKNGPHA